MGYYGHVVVVVVVVFYCPYEQSINCLVYCLQTTNVQLPRFKNSNRQDRKNATVTK